MSLKVKLNGEWTKIPTPSEIDDTTSSTTNTYSSSKIESLIEEAIGTTLGGSY